MAIKWLLLVTALHIIPFCKVKHLSQVYYIKNNPVKLSCEISKDTHSSVWWKVGEEYFFYTNDLELKQLDDDAGDSATLAGM